MPHLPNSSRLIDAQRLRSITTLTLPVLAEQLLNMTMGMVNAIMVSNIGKEAVSGISLVDSLNNVFLAFFSALALGGTVPVAHHVGRKDGEGANAAAGQALRSGLFIGLAVTLVVLALRQPMLRLLLSSAGEPVFAYGMDYLLPTAFSYPFLALGLIASGVLRGAGDTRTPMKLNILTNLINAILGLSLIYGLGWGVTGAGVANLAARCTGAVLLMLVLLRGKKSLRITAESLRKHNKHMRNAIFRIGIPSGIESLMFSGGKLITQAYIAALGPVAMAANYVASAAAGFQQLPGGALAVICTTLVGQSMGRGDPLEARRNIRDTMLASSLCLLVLGLLTFPIAEFLVRIFTSDPAVVKEATVLLRLIIVLSPFIWASSFLLPAGLRGAGDTRYPMVVSMVGMWVFRISMGWILAYPAGLGVLGVWLGMFIDWVVRSIFFYLRLAGKSWQQQTVHQDRTPPSLVEHD